MSQRATSNVLDEPTNHLDVDAREAQGPNAYDGAVILVSHDAHLVELVADRLWQVADGTCRAFEGNLTDYERELTEARRNKRRAERETQPPAGSNRKEARRERAEKRAETADLRKSLRDYEKRLENLAIDKESLEARLADPEVYDGPTAKLMELKSATAKSKANWRQQKTGWNQ